MLTAAADLTSLSFQRGFIEALVETFPASVEGIKVYEKTQKHDSICSTPITYCLEGWPDKKQDP